MPEIEPRAMPDDEWSEWTSGRTRLFPAGLEQMAADGTDPDDVIEIQPSEPATV